MMNIAGTEINLRYKAFEIYLSGCMPPHCDGCQNKELWPFHIGEAWVAALPKILEKIKEAKESSLISYIWILGGEPLDQNISDLRDMLESLKKLELPLVLWTHYKSLPSFISNFVDYVKFGPYVKTMEPYVEPVLGIELAGKSQWIVYNYK